MPLLLDRDDDPRPVHLHSNVNFTQFRTSLPHDYIDFPFVPHSLDDPYIETDIFSGPVEPHPDAGVEGDL
ncbi:hypothetical protein EW146_g10025 [Bondarzewia mesenterica]|uniref:Uncharacterized protein n=1 Tax=Bondarzewia mesenterica TaxID=1095465 RepID=A0A4S4L2Y6_9AGAM|nr:hypothetical protein EW146_g10025 [Bondarzewia mesenterica]